MTKNALASKKSRDKAYAAGLCIFCRKKKRMPGKSRCEWCIVKQREQKNGGKPARMPIQIPS